jgi:hypothetical protein
MNVGFLRGMISTIFMSGHFQGGRLGAEYTGSMLSNMFAPEKAKHIPANWKRLINDFCRAIF